MEERAVLVKTVSWGIPGECGWSLHVPDWGNYGSREMTGFQQVIQILDTIPTTAGKDP